MTQDSSIVYWKERAAEYKAAAQKWEVRSKGSNARAEVLLRELGKAIDRMKALETALDLATQRERLRCNGVDAQPGA